MTSQKSLRTQWNNLLVASLALGLASSTARAAEPTENVAPAVPARVEFNRDVRPILSDSCFLCHGPDKGRRKGDLRLDLRDEAIKAEALVPGKPDESALVERILSDDPGEIMPPPKSNKTLDARQKEILKRWVQQGAEYQKHWSYEKPVKAEVPAGRNAVDVLVRRRLAEVGLKASPEADRRTLIRRLSSDLTGLPPSPEEVKAFVEDTSPGAYERLVDRLMASPHYGERMAIGWLDVVRFADTIGYHSDNPRNVWPYRDWVIRSFNDNKPFDRFTIEQVAGDLLPDASTETRVGSAFNRLLLTTEEGGAQPKDYEARMLTDRVRAVGAAWLGQTTGCAQCHDHKFDPITMRDFYSLGAFFADIREPIIGHREDGMAVASAEDQKTLAKLDAAVAAAKERLEASAPQLDLAQAQWEADLSRYGVTLPELARDAKATPAEKAAARAVQAAIKKDAKARASKEREAVRSYFRSKATPLFAAEREAVAHAERERQAFVDGLPKCLVSVRSASPRTVRILPRGDWMNETGEVVKPALPGYLPQPRDAGRDLTRLDLARWLVSRENPLTARTVANRIWKQFFGEGLSRRLDDLGAQGEPPANPALLDWLACEFMDSGWDVKHIVRTIVTSETYRQTSVATPELLAADPLNRELARQGAFRVDAELVRDNALAISGLLAATIGGPSVKPYQPAGYWENLNFPPREYEADRGDAQHRRGLYTWWQRTFLHPSLLAFDAPSREECCAERNRSNIPQQALVLLNDPTYVEAARAFAARVLRECSGRPEDRLNRAWQLALQRVPESSEAEVARKLLETHLAEYRSNPAAARALISTGDAPVPGDLDAAELAAWTHVARVLLNLHETVTRS
ncbi:Planctomycete cytochrome C [Aquisphaera giovannonii]|uniref:Planctomycete cytochrome C n=1 Tax=Aquisphaera giovannonii TaxID=406548 RepID=A0A5B9WFZ8_9BACT|nr:PSD1 and planctomycete cytochrome C domain-containing protein [Aquisphaera giovannonii]QEH38921.1 Planctomycete cytochrome C [Aquisphaera giovannonii]